MVNNSYKYFGFTHFQLFPYISTHLTRSNITWSITNIFIFIYTRDINTTISINIFIFIYTRSTNITTSIFFFVYTRGTSTSTSTGTSTFTIFLITKLICTVPCSQNVYIIIRLFTLYPFLISLYSSVIKIFKRLSILSSINLIEKSKMRSFRAIFN